MSFGLIGDAYALGESVEKDLTIATKYYEIGSQMGNQYATYKLAEFTQADNPEAVEYRPEIAYKKGFIPYAVKNSINFPEKFYAVTDIVYDEKTDSLTRTLIF